MSYDNDVDDDDDKDDNADDKGYQQHACQVLKHNIDVLVVLTQITTDRQT